MEGSTFRFGQSSLPFIHCDLSSDFRASWTFLPLHQATGIQTFHTAPAKIGSTPTKPVRAEEAFQTRAEMSSSVQLTLGQTFKGV